MGFGPEDDYVSESSIDNPPREVNDEAGQLEAFPAEPGVTTDGDPTPSGDLLYQYELTLKIKKKGAKPITMTLCNEENYASTVYERLSSCLGWKRNKRVINAILDTEESTAPAPESQEKVPESRRRRGRDFRRCFLSG